MSDLDEGSAMAIGYACKTIGARDTAMRSCRLKNATEEKLMEIIKDSPTPIKGKTIKDPTAIYISPVA